MGLRDAVEPWPDKGAASEAPRKSHETLPWWASRKRCDSHRPPKALVAFLPVQAGVTGSCCSLLTSTPSLLTRAPGLNLASPNSSDLELPSDGSREKSGLFSVGEGVGIKSPWGAWVA